MGVNNYIKYTKIYDFLYRQPLTIYPHSGPSEVPFNTAIPTLSYTAAAYKHYDPRPNTASKRRSCFRH